MMKELITIINKVIDEHTVIFRNFQILERTVNDAEAIIGLDKATDKFMPGRFSEKQGLEELEQLLNKTERGVQSHFELEENNLLPALANYGDRKFVLSLRPLLAEHKNLSERIAHSKQEVVKLTSGNLSREIWEATGYDMRVYLSHTRRLFETHAQMEMELLHKLRDELTGKPKTND
jgi:iron-sulfur cluster repair protein YtfE (RIC family)